MIIFSKVYSHESISSLPDFSPEIFYIGNAIDDRTSEIVKHAKLKSTSNVKAVKYDNLTIELIIDNIRISLRDINEYFRINNFKKIVIDSTSLDFPEILYILHGINLSLIACEIIIIYIEPCDYISRNSDIKEEEDFPLSENTQNFSALPLFSINNNVQDKSVLIATLGFESSRLGQVLGEDDGACYSELQAMLGLPAYKPGWENRSLNKHLNYFSRIETSLTPYPACNPYEMSKKLTDFYETHSKIVVTSLGTKPSVIGICLFLVNNISHNTRKKQIGAVFDFPTKSKDRTNGIGKIYTYHLENTYSLK
ncbi:hypothetical protein [Shewanella glacialipiscicola]|uniref:hypothetical protein n=1 Tax=Shewanella glacialipiscicola TaxID=614069 RepID=UPI003D7BA6DA